MERIGAWFSRVARHTLPDPLVLAGLLTLLVFAAGFVFGDEHVASQADGASARFFNLTTMWLAGIWQTEFLGFALQMCIVLLTGFGLAKAPISRRFLQAMTARVRTGAGAVWLVATVSCVGCWINWGFGLIAAGVLAAQLHNSLQARNVRCPGGLLVASAYAGMMIWHGGMSGSAPLKVASDGVHFTNSTGGLYASDAIPIPLTIFSPANICVTMVVVILTPLLLRRMAGRGKSTLQAGASAATSSVASPPASAPHPPAATPRKDNVEHDKNDTAEDEEDDNAWRFADALNNSRVLSTVLAALLFAAVGRMLATSGLAAVNLNLVNSMFLALGLLLHRSLLAYFEAVAEGGKAIVGIVIQFPLYAGIQGVMFGAGLGQAISSGFVDASQRIGDLLGVGAGATFPLATMFSAGLVNFFVPSGGGQWIVQGPIMCEAASQLDLPTSQTVMAIAYGDQLTNMIQPFWAIPLIGMTGVRAREFLGYCALLMLLVAPVYMIGLMFY